MRPIGFNRVYSSVKEQTYDNVRHIVSVDNDDTKAYVDSYNDIHSIDIDVDEIIRRDRSKDPNIDNQYPMHFKRSHYNLYCNNLLREVDSGWVIFLDDDNYFINKNAISDIFALPNITSRTCIIWRVKFPNNTVIPTRGTMSDGPTLCNIDTACFAFNIEMMTSDISWDGWKCSDYRFIKKIYDKCSDRRYIDRPFVNIGQIGDGRQVDIY